MKKVGLVLQGGGMRVLYTAGVLDTFLEEGIEVDGAVGVSAGALFGLDYFSKQKGRTIRYTKKYATDKRYMGLGSFFRTGNIINKDFAYYEVPFKLDIFDVDSFEKARKDFYVAITNVDTGKAEYVNITKPLEQMEVLRATSAMPFVSRMVDIDGGKYLDGGICDNIPIDKCLTLGFDKIIVILTRPIDYRKKKTYQFLTRLRYLKHPKLAKAINTKHLNYNDTIEKIIDMKNKKEIFVIAPGPTFKFRRVEKRKEKLQEAYDLGVNDCKKIVNDLKQFLTE